MPELLLLAILFFAIAVVYASVGFGGGSSYLAILVLFGIPFPELRFYALACNISVVLGSVIYFHQQRILNWKRSFPLLILSVPAAFLGASIQMSSRFFFLALASFLLLAASMLAYKALNRGGPGIQRSMKTAGTSGIGGIVGFVSGLTGIGGGIYLSPILNLLDWDKPKKISATASLFILLNSVSGLGGQLFTYQFNLNLYLILILVISVWAGGFVGRRLLLLKYYEMHVRLLTAVLIAVVAARLYFIYI